MKPLCYIILSLLALTGCRPAQPSISSSDSPQRIISTAPALTELICAVGAKDALAGRTDVCNYPPEIIDSVPVIGKFATPNIEQVIALKPTHLFESFLVNSSDIDVLTRFNIKVEHIACQRIADIPHALRRIGEITGYQTRGHQLAVAIETGIENLRREQLSNRNSRPRTLILLDHLTPVTCGTNTYISEMVSLAGGENIATNLKREYDTISLEWIIEQQPELILCLYPIQTSVTDHFRNRAGWKNVPAVKNGRIRVPDDLEPICRPGPRVLTGITALKHCINDAL